MAPQFHLHCSGSAQARDTPMKPRLSPGRSGRAPWQTTWGKGQALKAQKAGLAGTDTHTLIEQALPGTPGQLRSSKPAEAKTQPNPKNKHRKIHEKGRPQVKGHQKHQHFTAAQNLTRHGQHHGTGKRRKQEGQRSKSLSVQLQKRYQRGWPRSARGLAFFFLFFFFPFFKLSFINNV